MTTDKIDGPLTQTPDLLDNYQEAEQDTTPPTACSSTAEVRVFHIVNTVFASSSAGPRKVTVNPVRIKESLKALERNKSLQRRGLG